MDQRFESGIDLHQLRKVIATYLADTKQVSGSYAERLKKSAFQVNFAAGYHGLTFSFTQIPKK